MMEQLNDYPFEIKPLSKEEADELSQYQTGPLIMEQARVGPHGSMLYGDIVETASEIYNMELRPSDVFVVTIPKSGTTWTQELVWLIGNDFDYKTAAEVKLNDRFPFIEFVSLENKLQQWAMENNPTQSLSIDSSSKIDSISLTEFLAKAPSPRFIKTHLPLCLLPPTLLDTAKVVYVARDPRDVAVSFYHHYKLFKFMGFTGDFKTYWKFFLENKITYGPYFPHVKEAWEKRNHPNMLFLFYEELSKDLPAVVRRVAQFFQKPVTEEQVSRLCDHLHIDNFRENKSVNLNEMKEAGMVNEDKKLSFIREGKTGGWRAYFDEEMTAQAERWIEDNLRDTDFCLPQL